MFWSPGHVAGNENLLRFTGFGANAQGAMPRIAKRDADIGDGLVNEPARLDGNMGGNDPSSFRPSENLVLVDTSYDRIWKNGGSYSNKSGSFGVFPGRNNVSLFTYNRSVAAAYLDGHVTAQDSEGLLWRATDQRRGIWLYNWGTTQAADAPWFLREHADGFWNVRY